MLLNQDIQQGQQLQGHFDDGFIYYLRQGGYFLPGFVCEQDNSKPYFDEIFRICLKR